MCACVRTTCWMLEASTGSGCQLRRRSSFNPWKRPQSIRTRVPFASTRYLDPVTVRAAPRNCRCAPSKSFAKLHRPCARMPGMPASVDLDRDLRGWFAQGLAAPRDDAAFSALALRVFAAQYDALAPYRDYCQRRGALAIGAV